MGKNASGKSSLLQAISLLSVNQMYGNDIRRIKYIVFQKKTWDKP
ncbi:MAG: hypothetical protein DRR08_06070 [Candidatus Parabeggiatoa sp. nov. 2]|nr:MAG: hypothetical protein B6247_05665 [Beggiatoa sp. 4572_84]RKZ62414.1 MAG: hypothetical protein DRR08_06070 [Gammaproteobacteria bacterium]